MLIVGIIISFVSANINWNRRLYDIFVFWAVWDLFLYIAIEFQPCFLYSLFLLSCILNRFLTISVFNECSLIQSCVLLCRLWGHMLMLYLHKTMTLLVAFSIASITNSTVATLLWVMNTFNYWLKATKLISSTLGH